ncbi:MAG: 16S rRNA (adenine(1518)-N(6)/adenine(1519)-N(6))-dimethyltransferase RsmA [Geminicoccaceae bacterium]
MCATCVGRPSSTSASDPPGARPRADRRLGQHFLFDPSILRRIVAAAGDLAGRTVVEVGPGPGGLTRALLAAGPARLVAIERDPRFVAQLRALETEAGGRLTIVAADALTVDPGAWADGGPVRIVANLPYNVATPLLFGWLDRLDAIGPMVLMFQKEVALRLVAHPGGADYGRLAVMAQLLCRVERLFDLPPAAFRPPPKVSSSVVRLTPRADRPPPELVRAVAAVARAAFGQRRKMLRSSLRGLVPDPATLLADAGIDGSRRAEELTLAEFRGLAERHLARGGA